MKAAAPKPPVAMAVVQTETMGTTQMDIMLKVDKLENKKQVTLLFFLLIALGSGKL